ANDVNCDEMVIDDHENVVVDNDHVEESIEKDVVNEDHNYDEEMAVEEEHEIEVNDDNIKELIELLNSSVGNDIEKDIEQIFSKYEQGSDDDQDEMESSRKSKRKKRNINNE
ncbi:11270_t:CDS:2, partial [Rhizophagus irregularis]